MKNFTVFSPNTTGVKIELPVFAIAKSVKVENIILFRKGQFSQVFRSSFSGSAQLKTTLKQTKK